MTEKYPYFLMMTALWLGGAAACNTNEVELDCGAGESLEFEGQTLCVYSQPIVIETGFACPRQVSHRNDLRGGAVACSGGTILTPRQIGALERKLERLGWLLGPGAPYMAPPLDLLLVIDNSFSMCEEQAALRDGFLRTQSLMLEARDFHIGITTTHAPESGVSIEPVALEGHLQSTPQPIPGNNQGCLRGPGIFRGEMTQFGPLMESLEESFACLRDDVDPSPFSWSDDQVECALRSAMSQQQTGCVASSGLPDRDGDGFYDIIDLFPHASDYRALPKVFRKQDYIDGLTGLLDTPRLDRDLRCAMLVGTRGDGYEKGLRVAHEAVSAAMTGGYVGAADADVSAPNHGFIRDGADFALVIMTDENDCSHDGTMMELGNACGADVCEYYNSSALAPEDTPLLPPAQLAESLLDELAATKRVTAVNPDTVFVAPITGKSARFDLPFPACGGEQPLVVPTCATPRFGDAYSGDRYERYAQLFPNHYLPASGAQGSLCLGEIDSALSQIASYLIP